MIISLLGNIKCSFNVVVAAAPAIIILSNGSCFGRICSFGGLGRRFLCMPSLLSQS